MTQDFTAELVKLMVFTGETAIAIRMYSAYSNGSPSSYLHRNASPEQEQVELMYLADALHHFSQLGRIIQVGTPSEIAQAASDLLEAFGEYTEDRPERGVRNAKKTFESWAGTVRLQEAMDAIGAIKGKATLFQDSSA